MKIELPIKSLLPVLTSLLRDGHCSSPENAQVRFSGPKCLFLRCDDGKESVTLHTGTGTLEVTHTRDATQVNIALRTVEIRQPKLLQFFRNETDVFFGLAGAYFQGTQRELMLVWNDSHIAITPTASRLMIKKPGLDATVTGIRLNSDGSGYVATKGMFLSIEIECV